MMLRVFIAFVYKEVLHIIRDPRTLVILFGLPIALVLIFGYTVTNEFKNASIAIVDQSKDPLSLSFVHHLTASDHFKLSEIAVNGSRINEIFKSGTAKIAVVIPPNFQRDFYGNRKTTLQLITDASEPNYATTLTTYAMRMIQTFEDRARENNSPRPIEVESRMFYNPRLVGAFNFIPGVVALILMLISAMMTSLTLAKEKETGTMDLLLVSPLPPLIIILGKVTPYIVLSFVNAIVVFVMGYVIFDVPVKGSIPLLLGLCLLYLVVSLALGILISTKSSTQQQAMMSSLFTLLMPTMLLSGFMFPIASMPSILQYISKIVPANYFFQIELAIMLKGAGWEAISRPTAVLCIMLIVLLLGAWKNFKVSYK